MIQWREKRKKKPLAQKPRSRASPRDLAELIDKRSGTSAIQPRNPHETTGKARASKRPDKKASNIDTFLIHSLRSTSYIFFRCRRDKDHCVPLWAHHA